MAEVVLDNVTKVYPGNVVAVRSVSLHIKDKEFLVLVGPSGCGKSTTLRMIAGLEEITDGAIRIGDRVVNDVPPKDRDIAMVFQNYALYPHMTVYKNMAFGLKLRKYPKDEIDQRVAEAAKILGITDLLDRKPRALSGGEKQRVAVGRAIVRKPKAFLFDEPLSNLDAKLRVEMRAELNKLHQRLQTTMIYVTHDQVEAMTLGDRIVVMNNGVIQQVAEPLELYDKPRNKFVAGFIGTPPMNFLDGTLEAQNGAFYFNEGSSRLRLPDEFAPKVGGYVGKTVTFGIRPESIYDSAFYGETTEGSTLETTVNVVEPLGDEMILYLSTGRHDFIGKVDSHHKVEVNQEMEVVFDLRKAHLFDRDTGENITLDREAA
ncbi:MAG: sn-glycerol-3-phosphate ABC transporter ATP-binding protein UgpC [Planctomycetes bacterium]|nr:sn-glycerol-3-phosphate ABC transporter ATP-binding protein UgpC [Planctomycetota bacterium]MBM4078739.1 sn-glycerol-3-phosphate ABC transporter ATP-binding protein UgpC [Planctomycetota bacterium]MBM4083786.1 sn-glycerol-3-phosphate ABC transporter ATP-binding protein UgpC [Planctomycetota bacterium]